MGLHHKHHSQAGASQQQQPSLLARALDSSPDPAPARAGMPGQGRNRLKALFIGLGGGTLPLALHHHFPGMDIDTVELDAVVVEAARSAMAFPADRQVFVLD